MTRFRLLGLLRLLGWCAELCRIPEWNGFVLYFLAVPLLTAEMNEIIIIKFNRKGVRSRTHSYSSYSARFF